MNVGKTPFRLQGYRLNGVHLLLSRDRIKAWFGGRCISLFRMQELHIEKGPVA